MSILIFVLSLILLIAAAASGYASVDLLPTSTGVLYALAGAAAACAAVVTFALAVLIRRVDRLTKLAGPASEVASAPLAIEAGVLESLGEPGSEDESPINFNRSGHLPSLETIETVLETPEEQGPPSLIGSYSSAGANYKIFSD